MRRSSSRTIQALSILSFAAFAGCDLDALHQPVQTETQSLALDETDSADVRLSMNAGELTVGGGSAKLMEGEFAFSPAELKPRVDYHASGSIGHLLIEEPSHLALGRTRTHWNVRLNDAKPIDLEVSVGAGEGRLQLGSLNLRRLNINMGAGELHLDLRGTPTNDYDVNLRGGVGEATIQLPRDVGVLADVKGGLGDIRTHGLEKRDGRYVNTIYGTAKTTVHLDIRGGVGSITLDGQ